MSRNAVTGLVVALFVVGLMVAAAIFVHRAGQMPLERPELATAVSAVGPSAGTGATGAQRASTSVATSSSHESLILPEATQKIISACLAKSPWGASAPSTLEALKEQIAARAAEQAELQEENVHIRRAGGEVLRLRVTPDESAARRVRVFTVDAENLPVPAELPTELVGLEPQEAVGVFRGLGDVTYDARRTSQALGLGLAVNALEENGRIVELQIFFGGGGASLGCSWSERVFEAFGKLQMPLRHLRLPATEARDSA